MGVWLRDNSENSIIPTEFEGDTFSYMFYVAHCRENCQYNFKKCLSVCFYVHTWENRIGL